MKPLFGLIQALVEHITMNNFPKLPSPRADVVEISRISYDRFMTPTPFKVFQMVKVRELCAYLQNNNNIDWRIMWDRGDSHFSVELYVR